MKVSKEQKCAIDGEMSESGLNRILDLLDEYIELLECVASIKE